MDTGGIVSSSLDDPFSVTLATLVLPLRSWDAQRQQELWDRLDSWLTSRGLYLGGRPDAAAIYCSDAQRLQSHWQALRRWLQAEVEGEFELVPVDGEKLDSPGLQRAALQAVGFAQVCLTEQLEQSVRDMSRLVLAGAVQLTLRVSADGSQMTVAWPRRQFELSLRRIDGQAEARFEALRQAALNYPQLYALLGPLQGLPWTRVDNDGDLSVGEWHSEVSGWQLNIHAHPGSGLTHEEVMRSLQLMLSDR